MTLHTAPDRQRALVHYRQLVPEYDASCQYIEGISQDAIDSLRIQPGETVFDSACGTGTTLLAVARQVGQDGRAVGVELVPEMAVIASRKLEAASIDDQTTVYIGAVKDFVTDLRADAMLLCYTHDVLHFTIDEQYHLGSSYRASGTVREQVPSGMECLYVAPLKS